MVRLRMLPVDPLLWDFIGAPIVLAAVVWFAYWEVQQGSWVSDDWEGISTYSGKFKRTNNASPAPTVPTVTDGTPKGASLWSDALTWVRFQLCKVPNLDAKTAKERPYIANARKHHQLNMLLGAAVVVLAYLFLGAVTGDYRLAFGACVLWAVHPVGAQCIGWISGIGYVLAALFMFAGLNLAWLVTSTGAVSNPWVLMGALVVYGGLQFLAYRSQFTAMAAVVILAWLGMWPFAAVALLVAVVGSWRVIHEVVSVRSAVFHQQQMSQSTRFHLRKIIVAMKTLAYYVGLVFWPKRLGLYHTFGYHYPLPQIEQEDRHFWAGGIIAMLMTGAILWATPPIPLALVWFGAYIFVVLNWITVHQFVSERYVWVPSLGLCLIVAAFAPTWLFWAAVGAAIMRTWAHLPTYFNELTFYQSNVWNHPTSEVAIGNLGCTFMRFNLPGAAVDHWTIGTRVNPDYDVNWYNLYSLFRGQGQHKQAREYLVKALSSPMCHFPVPWKKELDTLDMEMSWLEHRAKVPPEHQLAWEREQLELMWKMPPEQVPHRDYWEAKKKRIDAEWAAKVAKETTAATVVEAPKTA